VHEHTLTLACFGIALVGSALLAVEAGRRRRRRDPVRFFTREQKHALLARAGHRCEHKPLIGPRCSAVSRLEADHVVPWSRGGLTRIGNGAILCRKHNRRKSDRAPSALYRWRLARRRRKHALRSHQ
jgi:hypothetical protein